MCLHIPFLISAAYIQYGYPKFAIAELIHSKFGLLIFIIFKGINDIKVYSIKICI